MYESVFFRLSDNLFGNDRCHFKNFIGIQYASAFQARPNQSDPSLLYNIIRHFELSIRQCISKVYGRSLQSDINIKFGCIFSFQ
jgi:hypothetical protein